jgi:hypothetical protein
MWIAGRERSEPPERKSLHESPGRHTLQAKVYVPSAEGAGQQSPLDDNPSDAKVFRRRCLFCNIEYFIN